MIKLWGRRNSSNVQKVLWCLDELGLRYEQVDIGGPFGGNSDPAYLALNPNGLVPTLQEDGVTIWESNTIVRYLAARHGAGTLWPLGSADRAAAERWMDWQLGTLAPHMGTLFMSHIRTPPEQRDLGAMDRAFDAAIRLFRILDSHLANRAYVAGDRLTVGDIPVGIMAYRWFALPLQRPDYPALSAWSDRLAERPAYQKHVIQPLT
jgi:glutathione S-transferase